MSQEMIPQMFSLISVNSMVVRCVPPPSVATIKCQTSAGCLCSQRQVNNFEEVSSDDYQWISHVPCLWGGVSQIPGLWNGVGISDLMSGHLTALRTIMHVIPIRCEQTHVFENITFQ